MLKWLLSLFKPEVENVVSQLKASRDQNIAAIEAKVGEGGAAVETVVAGFLVNEAKRVPIIGAIAPFVEPALVAELTALVGQGTNDVPALYDAGVAWLEKEEGYL